ncbi:hypothetical protein R3P38DRAFT_3206469 [Favolaschia claudopus]|uniref:Uncharacterized protein n=1 Tax=Favolaschia claudopus TaxID=2862362 RepID=A0AAW0AN07_9AGAR
MKRAAVIYTPGHSAWTSSPARLNDEADRYASQAQRHLPVIPTAPIPTFFIDKYTLYCSAPHEGWVEGNTWTTVDTLMVQNIIRKLGVGNRFRMSTWIHDPRHPPELTLALSNCRQPTCFKNQTDFCRFGCSAMKTPHHLLDTISSNPKKKLDDSGVDKLHSMRLLHVAKPLFQDDLSWPLTSGHYLYCLGQLPNLDLVFPRNQTSDKLGRRKLFNHLASTL